MNTLVSDDEKIMTVWNWCSDAYLQHGIRLKLPANTDHTTTYQWRYARAITNKFAEWGFDDATSIKFIQIAVKHCKEAGVLRKGLASLHQSNLLKICYNQLKKSSDSNVQTIESLEHVHNWVRKRAEGNLLANLLYRNDPYEYCNLVKWVKATRITHLYLALSKTCYQALDKLSTINQEERLLLPPVTALYMLRSEFIEDANNLKRVKQILGKEWR